MKNKEYLHAILKSAGGKSRFKEKIESYYVGREDKRWVDVFCGGISIPLYLNPKRVWINDLNKQLIDFYQLVLSKGKCDLIEFKNEEEYYYEIRNNFNLEKDGIDIELISNMYYMLNRTCFNGLMRYNKKGFFNSPFGHYKYTKYSPDFSEHQLLMKDWKITNLDWRNVISDTTVDDFLFLDPPYFTPFVAYTKEGFTWEDQVELANAASCHPGPVLVTNSGPGIRELYSDLGFRTELMYRTERIGGKTDKRGKQAEEIFAFKS